MSGWDLRNVSGGQDFQLREGNVVLCWIDQDREAGFLGDLKELRREDCRIDASFTQGRESRAGAAGLENRHVFVGDQAVALKNECAPKSEALPKREIASRLPFS